VAWLFSAPVVFKFPVNFPNCCADKYSALQKTRMDGSGSQPRTTSCGRNVADSPFGMLGTTDVREYGQADGLRSIEGVKRNRSVVSDPLGRIWFSLSRGLSVAGPSHLEDNSALAIAHVEVISADGSPLNTGGLMHVPGSRKRITFAYTVRL